MKLSEMSGDDLIKLREKCVNKINTNKDKRIEELEELLEAADLRNAEMVVDLEKLEKALREIYSFAIISVNERIKQKCEEVIPELREEK